MGAIFAAVFSLVFAVPLVVDSYFPHLPLEDNLKYSFFGGLALTWAVLPTIASGPHWLSFGLSLLFPLLGLLLLNSKRHREMRGKLVDVQRLRQAIIATRKAR
ncbi:hypothetical protein [Pseudomonas poae]|uniref:Uncharacterized protein n=1 Tax=Pseudomonas poae TaxID=200451 RepID=A0ABY0RIE0_9PSED|nr:hypothetical protein [Pseudomonas poae]SDO13586.1 hypothetical protein SAMN04490208_2689 [Pseudomonas poae]